jgi:hypothetical protein
MSDKDSILRKVADEIAGAAATVEDFADKFAAPEEPDVIVPDEDAPTAKPSANRG